MQAPWEFAQEELRDLRALAHEINDRLRATNILLADYGGPVSIFGARSEWERYRERIGPIRDESHAAQEE